MTHNLKISVRRLTVKERLLNFLLGSKHGLTIILPSDGVKETAIIEVKEGELA